MIEIALPDIDATAGLAGRIAPFLAAGDVIGLEGTLGAGKTAFARALIRVLAGPGGQTGPVPSPTFTLVQVYETPAAAVWHFDLYRLDRAEDVEELAIEEAFAAAISVIEWPERLGPFLPPAWLEIRFEITGDTTRKALVTGHGGRGAELEAALKETVS